MKSDKLIEQTSEYAPFRANSNQYLELLIKKSPRNKALTIHARYICNDREMMAFTAVTFDGLSAEDTQNLDKLFEAFRFP